MASVIIPSVSEQTAEEEEAEEVEEVEEVEKVEEVEEVEVVEKEEILLLPPLPSQASISKRLAVPSLPSLLRF